LAYLLSLRIHLISTLQEPIWKYASW
jgi:hypothetical protein